jgi:hypothetical protein
MVYGPYAIFNNISVISWWSVLLLEETGVPRENHRPVASHLHNVVIELLNIEIIEKITRIIRFHEFLMVNPDLYTQKSEHIFLLFFYFLQ